MKFIEKHTIQLLIGLMVIWSVPIQGIAHQKEIDLDSLKKIIERGSSDTITVNALREAFALTKRNDMELAISYCERLYELSVELKYDKGIASGHTCFGNIHEAKGEYDLAKARYLDALEVYRNSSIRDGEANSYGNIGNLYNFTGKYKEAIESYLKAIQIQDSIGDAKGMANNYNNIGVAYYYLQNFNKAEEYWLLTIEVFRKLDNKTGIAYCLNNLGMIFTNKVKDFEIANIYYHDALDILIELDDKKGMATAYNNIGETYFLKKEYEEALSVYAQALVIKRQVGDRRGEALTLNNIGKVYLDKGALYKAISYFLQSLKISEDIGNLDEVKGSYENLAETYTKLGDYKNALKYQVLFGEIKDSIWDKENSEAIAEMETKYQSEKKEKENQLLKKENELDQVKLNRNKIVNWMGIGGTILLAVVLIVVYQALHQKKKSHRILEEKNKIIEQKNKDVLDSITYAKRIQEAILPPDNMLDKHSKDMFVYYKPKDIVSGDFYWMAESSEYFLFAVVDCTGHGVPGAFMSIIGNNGLNKAVNEGKLTVPSEILEFLDHYVEETLNKTKEGRAIRDGMDLALCCYNRKTKVLQYSGANNSLYIYGQNITQRIPSASSMAPDILDGVEIKANKQPIGFTIKQKKEFVNHQFQLQENDCIYIFSDGYADQFGGEKGSKFMSKRMKQMLSTIYSKDMEAQKNVIDHTLIDWMGNHGQLDDICMIGLKT